MSAVELRGAAKIFADAEIDASLRVDSGQQLVLLGPSGCGKSTVLRLIAGLIEPDRGDVYIGGESMRGVPPEARDAAMVFQSHELFPFRTVAENVGYGLKIRKVAASERVAKVQSALAAVHLDGYQDRWPDELSGGERQRTALARAIIVEPRVLLLDEPFSSLDPALRRDLQQLVCEVQQSLGITSVFVTHDHVEAQVVGDAVAIMIDGQVDQVGETAKVFAAPATDRVAQFLDLAASS